MTPFHYAYLEINGEIEYFSFQNAKLEGKSKYIAAKVQLISKGLFGILNSSKKRTKNYNLSMYYDSRLVFVLFLEEFEDTIKTFRK